MKNDCETWQTKPDAHKVRNKSLVKEQPLLPAGLGVIFLSLLFRPSETKKKQNSRVAIEKSKIPVNLSDPFLPMTRALASYRKARERELSLLVEILFNFNLFGVLGREDSKHLPSLCPTQNNSRLVFSVRGLVSLTHRIS